MNDNDSNNIQYEVDLPVTVVKPEDWQTEILAAFKGIPIFTELHDIHSWNRSRSLVEDSTDLERRFYNVWALAGKPKVKNAYNQPSFLYDLASLFGGDMGTKEYPRAYTIMSPLPYGIPLGNSTMYITGVNDAIAEMSHPIQHMFGENNGFINIFDPFRFKDNSNPQNGAYGNPKAYEYETHRIFEPLLWDYIFHNIVPDFLKQGNYDSK